MNKIFGIFLFSLFFNLFSIEIVKDGKAQAFILLESNAPPPIRMAADEISAYAKKITGVSLPILENNRKKGDYIISFRIAADPATGTEGYKITGTDNALLITGGTPRAVLYGAYAFIEEFFGVRWFAPGELYEHVPSQKSLILPDKISRRANPEFAVRKAGFVSCNWNSDLSNTWKFLARNRWQVKGNHRLTGKFADLYNGIDVTFSGGGHCLASLIPDKLFDTHPEYFALVKGKRIKQINSDGKAISQPCTTHPEVIALAVQGIIEYFDKAPPGASFLIGNNDVQIWCECERCSALDPPEEKKMGYVSTRFYTFINAVADGVRKKHPEAKILGWGYQNYRFAPTGIKPDPDLRINLCDHQRCYRHSLLNTSCRQNDIIRKMFLSWRAYNLPVTERGYQESLLKNGYFYLPLEYVIAEDLRYFKEIGVDGYEFITTAPDGIYRKSIPAQKAENLKNAMYCLWPAIYICGKMFWDTSLDPKMIWEDAGSRFYGKSWSVMKEYRKLLREAYTKTAGHIVYGNSPVELGRALQKPGIEKKLIALLTEAEKLAAGDPDKKVAARLAMEKKYFIETWIKNARAYEKTQNAPSMGSATSEHIVIDGKMNEISWENAEYISGLSGVAEAPENPADIFVKLLFDHKYIYLAVTGTAPADNEKWIISFPDHNDLSAPLKKFDLDADTPFTKAKSKNGTELCYELMIPRSLIGLNNNSAGFSVNINRYQHPQNHTKLYRFSPSPIALGKEGLKNGNFRKTHQKILKNKNNQSVTVPKFWGGAEKGWTFEKNHIKLHGTIYQFLTVSGEENGGILKVDIRCAATGKSAFIQPYLILCRREPGDRRKFRHEIKKYGKKIPVNARKIHHFSFRLEPYEKGYFYLTGRNVVVESITTAFSEQDAE